MRVNDNSRWILEFVEAIKVCKVSDIAVWSDFSDLVVVRVSNVQIASRANRDTHGFVKASQSTFGIVGTAGAIACKGGDISKCINLADSVVT